MRSGPPTMLPRERSSSCIGRRAAYINAMSSTAITSSEAATLSGQSSQDCRLMSVPPFHAHAKSEPHGAVHNFLPFMNYVFGLARKKSRLLLNHASDTLL